MIPLYVYDQLAIVGLLWLYVMLHYVWPSRGTVAPPPPVQPAASSVEAQAGQRSSHLLALYQH